jgi:mannose-6-phosphate isomerase-like protein (cupin superfamily)
MGEWWWQTTTAPCPRGQLRQIKDPGITDLRAERRRHYLENPGQIDLELIEVQTGSYLGEDDIERIEDDYHCS